MGLLEELQKQMAGQGMFGGQYQPPQLTMGDLAQAPPPPGIDPAQLQDLVMRQPAASLGPQPDPYQTMEQRSDPQSAMQPAPDPYQLMSGMTTPQQSAPRPPPGLTPGSMTVRQEQGGPPPAVQAQTMGVQGQNQLDDMTIQRDATLRQAQAMEDHAAKLRAQVQVETEQRQQQEKELAAKQERLRDQQMELASQVDEPPDPKRYFKNMNMFEKIGAVIQAGVYGYLNPKGGANPIIQDLQQMASQDVKEQLEDRANNRQRRAGLIDQYERQYGDTGLVQKRLEADRLITMGKTAFAEAQEADSAEAKGRAMDLTRGLAGKAKVLHQEIQRAMYGKPVEVSTTYARPPKVKGAGVMTPDKELKQKEAELKLQEIKDTGRTPERNKEIRGEVGDIGTKLQPTMDMHNAIDAITEAGGIRRDRNGDIVTGEDVKGRGPVDAIMDRDSKKKLEAAQKNAVDILGRMRSGGAISSDEEATFKDILGGGAWTESGMTTSLGVFDKFLRQREAELRSLSSPEAIEEFDRRIESNTKKKKPAGASVVTGKVSL